MINNSFHDVIGASIHRSIDRIYNDAKQLPKEWQIPILSLNESMREVLASMAKSLGCVETQRLTKDVANLSHNKRIDFSKAFDALRDAESKVSIAIEQLENIEHEIIHTAEGTLGSFPETEDNLTYLY